MQNITLSKNIPMVIDVNTLKAHLRIEHDYEDEYIKSVIKMATGIIESQLSISMLIKEYQLSCYPTACDGLHKVKLPIRNIVEITNVSQDNKPIKYEIQRNNSELLLFQVSSDDPVLINYKAGISDCLQHIPDEFKFAVLQIAKNIYDCSEENILESKYIKNIIQHYNYFEL